MDAQSTARFSTVEEHSDTGTISALPASCFGNCGACGTKLGPDRSPQLLPCLHSLCQQCVPQAVGVDRRECPVCGVEYALTEVFDNLFFTESQEITQCGGCGGAEAGAWCMECGEALCPECVSAHKRVKVTREHNVLPQRPPSVSAPTMYCKTHREERVKLICLSCDQPTCRECQLTFHQNHRFQFLHEAIADEKDQIRSLMEDVKLQRLDVRRSLCDLDKRLLDLKELQNKLNGELRDAIMCFREVLLKRAMSLAMEVQELCGSEERSILERREVLRKLEERQAYLLSFTKRAMDTEGYSALLSYRRKIQSQIWDVISHAVSPGDYMLKLTLHCTQGIYSRMAMFGKVVVEKVPFACTNNESAISKDPHLHKHQNLNNQGFSTTKTPPTSSLNPPTYSDSLTSAHKPAASTLTLPSASSQTSTTLNSDTYTHKSTVSSHDPHTLSSSQIQTAFSNILTTSSFNISTSSRNPPTYSGNPPAYSRNPLASSGNPPAHSGNPPAHSGNPPAHSGNPPAHSGNPPAYSRNPPTSCHHGPTSSRKTPASSRNPPNSGRDGPTSSHDGPGLSQVLRVYNPPGANLSSPPHIQPCLSSPFPLQLPVALYSVPLNFVSIVPNPPASNCQRPNANTPAIQTAANSPCSQTLPTVAQATILPEAPGLSEPMALDTVAGLFSTTKDQTPRGTFLVPPVKALADSPCERTPPAGSEQEEPVDPAAAENEPTSTVAEWDSTESTGDPSEEVTDSAGADLKTPTLSPKNSGSKPRNLTQAMLGDQSDLFGCPVEEDDDSADECDDQEPWKADRSSSRSKGDSHPLHKSPHLPTSAGIAGTYPKTARPASASIITLVPLSSLAIVPRLQALTDLQSLRAPPTGRKKRQADPVAVDTRPASTAAETNDSREKGDWDTESFWEPREADKRRLVPRVSLVQLPVSFPPPGHPLPQFQLFPSANKQEVHLHSTGESSFTKCQKSQKFRCMRWSLKRKGLPLSCTATPVLSKKAKSVNMQGTTGIPKEECHWAITEEIRKECEKTRPNEGHIKAILKETAKTRRAWIERMPPGNLVAICKLYPCFKLGNFIMSEFSMLLGEKKFHAIPQRAENFLNVMESMMGAQEEGELRMLPVLMMIEEYTKFEKGQSLSAFTVCKGASPGDLQLESCEMEPPRLVLHVTDDSLLDAFVVGDTVTACAQADTVLEAVVTLLGAYYTFHLQYPRIYSQALGFLQHHLLGHTYIGPRSNRFKILSKEFVKCRKEATRTPNKNAKGFAPEVVSCED
ncbi:hypothetical protein SKAU_G00408030 [Synaphobranchus kaupii]|uniref:Uncharacterized protein n=1 Tax=Synaphobranchus kaupii TaxID=118154 RepID=A0A9Q1EAD9_SYNKA|nr:hypothetical protein SKAU_G00408030 [Synaphobranchus kaupii]